ncbi:6-phosphogluconolactonase [Novipirellula aureliae]|nr:6-phosphogluconolactonase [Novipirellula aureliae]
MSIPSVQPYPTLADLYKAASKAFCNLANECISEYGVFRVSLSGGSTPKRLYEMIACESLQWNRIHWFFGDERNVPPESPDSNFRMVHEALLSKIDAPESNVHPVMVNLDDPATAANEYQCLLEQHFQGQKMPVWDLVLLGMGDDSHTASLFPNTAAIEETSRWFVENWVEKFDAYRYTLTAPAINSAIERWFLVSGESKRQALANVWSDPLSVSDYPAQLIDATEWFVTEDAMPR